MDERGAATRFANCRGYKSMITSRRLNQDALFALTTQLTGTKSNEAIKELIAKLNIIILILERYYKDMLYL